VVYFHYCGHPVQKTKYKILVEIPQSPAQNATWHGPNKAVYCYVTPLLSPLCILFDLCLICELSHTNSNHPLPDMMSTRRWFERLLTQNATNKSRKAQVNGQNISIYPPNKAAETLRNAPTTKSDGKKRCWSIQNMRPLLQIPHLFALIDMIELLPRGGSCGHLGAGNLRQQERHHHSERRRLRRRPHARPHRP
jgi:hypothetical protein